MNNAGIQGAMGQFVSNDLELWKKTIAVNLFGTIHMTKLVLPYMIRQNKGKIINLSGGGATSPRPNFTAYACSKAAIVGTTEALAQELRSYNIDINAVATGAMNTAMTYEVLDLGPGVVGEEEFNQAKKRLQDGGTDPQIPADLILFLASEKADGLTGRLISAIWDNWQEWDREEIKKIMETDKYSLRRVK